MPTLPMLRLVCMVSTEVNGQVTTVLGTVLRHYNLIAAATYYIIQSLDHIMATTHKGGQQVQQWVRAKVHGAEVILVLLTVRVHLVQVQSA